jgi:hypothetical protein
MYMVYGITSLCMVVHGENKSPCDQWNCLNGSLELFGISLQ